MQNQETRSTENTKKENFLEKLDLKIIKNPIQPKKNINFFFFKKGGFAKCYEIILQESKKTFAAKVIPKSTLNQSRARQKV